MFYGWRIVSVVFLTHFISVGLVFYSYGVFFKTLATEFGGSRLGVATGLVIMNVVVAAVCGTVAVQHLSLTVQLLYRRLM